MKMWKGLKDSKREGDGMDGALFGASMNLMGQMISLHLKVVG